MADVVPFPVIKTEQNGEYEIKTYNVSNVEIDQGDDDLYTLQDLFDGVNKYRTPGTPSETMGEGTLLGMIGSATAFRVAFKGDEPVGVHIKYYDEGEDKDADMKFGMKAAFDAPAAGGRRSRLKKQTRRSKRHTRNHKGRKLRKLATRRR
jgi:hypothetical protein